MARTDVDVRSLIVATDIDVLPDSAAVTDHGEYVVIRSATNPTHYWGNYLLLREPPAPGTQELWEARFEQHVGGTSHRTITWDDPSGAAGAIEEFEAVGYVAEELVGLIARPQELVAHPRASDEVEIVTLDGAADEALWQAATELQVANREAGHDEAGYRTFVEARMRDRRTLIERGDGAWFLARTAEGEAVASCGVIITDGRARFQAVDTLEAWRRRGIARRLVHDAGQVAVERYGAGHLVIVADAGYHALPLYESLGFQVRERSRALAWWPGAPRAHEHPTLGRYATPAE